MKKLLYMLPLIMATAAMATDWDACIQYLHPEAKPNKDYFVTQGADGWGLTWYLAEPAPTKEQLVAVESEALVAKEQKFQDAKSARQKALENRYFEIMKDLYTLANDPRKDVVPTPKAENDDASALIEACFDAGGATEKKATKIALKLTNTQVQLDKINASWWDHAKIHQ